LLLLLRGVPGEFNIDHYTSNAIGVNGGFGLTYKFSKFSNERLYMEARYVFIPNSQTTASRASSPASVLKRLHRIQPVSAEQQPHHYIPVKFGIRF